MSARVLVIVGCVLVAASCQDCTRAGAIACNTDGDCIRSQLCRNGFCVDDLGEGEGEGSVGEGEGAIGEGEGDVGEGEGEGEGGEGEGEGAFGGCVSAAFATDRNDCGECDNVCANAGVDCDVDETCSGGGCACTGTSTLAECASGSVNCGNGCVSLKTNAQNCGECGNACFDDGSCPGGVQCVDGGCTCPASPVLVCPVGQIECNGACVDPSVDGANCSECNNSCGAESCASAACN